MHRGRAHECRMAKSGGAFALAAYLRNMVRRQQLVVFETQGPKAIGLTNSVELTPCSDGWCWACGKSPELVTPAGASVRRKLFSGWVNWN